MRRHADVIKTTIKMSSDSSNFTSVERKHRHEDDRIDRHCGLRPRSLSRQPRQLRDVPKALQKGIQVAQFDAIFKGVKCALQLKKFITIL